MVKGALRGMTDDRDYAVCSDCDSVLGSSNPESARINELRLKASLGLANMLALASLAGAFYADVYLGKHWTPDEWVFMLIAAPYGGLLLAILSKGKKGLDAVKTIKQAGNKQDPESEKRIRKG